MLAVVSQFSQNTKSIRMVASDSNTKCDKNNDLLYNLKSIAKGNYQLNEMIKIIDSLLEIFV